MFSAIPLNFSTKIQELSNVTISDVTGSTKLMVPGRVTAAGDIPQGARTGPIKPDLLCGSIEVVQVLVSLAKSGNIELDQTSKQLWFKHIHWIRCLRLAENCYNYNIQLKFQQSHNKANGTSLILEAVKPISVGQELILWFSEDILALMHIAFLTPANIQGQKRYICNKCSAIYESPNPLKVHMTLSCGRLSVADLWAKLSHSLIHSMSDALTGSKFYEFSFKLHPEVCITKHNNGNAIDLTTPSIRRPISQPSNCTESEEYHKPLYRPFSEPSANSAFKPFHKSPSLQTAIHYPANLTFYSNANVYLKTAQQSDEAHIETLVSSLGKSKEGHVCLYCGKCYSRKYGLKIHIRTHTGYKPLKCKFCSRPFGDPSNLNKHVRLHAEGDTPYKCDLCGKILVRRRDLERHLKSRHMGQINPGRAIFEEPQLSEAELTGDENENT